MILIFASVAFAAFYLFWTREVYPRMVAKLTSIPDLHDPAFGTRSGPKIKGTAVVCGGSIAGVLSAAVLSRHFEKVIIVESDDLPIISNQIDGGTFGNIRSRVPQYLQPHAFLTYALLTYRKLFPSFDDELVKLGGQTGHFRADFYALGKLLAIDKAHNSIKVLTLSRDGLEPLARRLLLQDSTYSNVSLLRGTVINFQRSSSTGPISSVRIRTGAGDKEQQIESTFIVDTTGRTSLGSKLLPKLSVPPIQQTFFTPGQVYSSILIKISEATKREIEASGALEEAGQDEAWDNVGYLTVVGPSEKRFGGYLANFDGDRLMCTITYSTNDPEPSTIPTSAADLVAAWSTIGSFSPSSLKIADIAIKASIKEDPTNKHALQKHDVGKSYWWAYGEASKANAFPQNWVAIGDAHMKVNPHYASGTLTAATQAVTLDAALRTLSFSETNPNGFAHAYFSKVDERLQGNWTLMTALDFGHRSCVPSGLEPKLTIDVGYPIVRYLFGTVYQAGTTDKDVAEQIFRVMNMIDPPFSLFAPWVLWRVILAKRGSVTKA